ncbi:MAG: hypothetical protein IJ137_08165 [Eubacterium sp.]|nr:hypothetical protein [Eubacterium sp.]
MPPYSILMFLFSAGLLLYAILMAVTKDYNILPYRSRVSVKPKDPKAYMTQFSKVTALTAAAPVLSGLTAIWNFGAAMVVLIAGFVIAIWIGTRIMRNAS